MNYFPLVFLFFYCTVPEDLSEYKKAIGTIYTENRCQTTSKAEAFTVLQNKCNVCHATKKRTNIFTFENMDSLAVAIHNQVFIKKKMPKGRKIKLTEDDLLSLEKWLTANLKKTK